MELPLSFRDLAASLGFEAVYVTHPKLLGVEDHLKEWVTKGYHGDMAWMADRLEERASPAKLWSEVQSVIVLGMNYGAEIAKTSSSDGVISIYAQGDDYHDVIKPRLKTLARHLIDKLGGDVKVFVDTAPVSEKALAMQAGLGWQGKHTNLVSKDYGSWLFLGAIYSTLPLDASIPMSDHCGSCDRCLTACPTNAFVKPYVLDARRCISYLTIENKETIPLEFRKAIGNKIYGCDDCLAACPWNKFASIAELSEKFAREELNNPPLSKLLTLNDADFRTLFRKSPVKRIGRDRFIRNCLVAAGNSNDLLLLPLIEDLINDPSPLVSEMAIWAKGEY